MYVYLPQKPFKRFQQAIKYTGMSQKSFKVVSSQTPALCASFLQVEMQPPPADNPV